MADVDYLYETPETGMLQQGADGKAFRLKTDDLDTSRPSLSGPYTGPGASKSPSAFGIGGTVVGSESPASPRPPRQVTPDQMMAAAMMMEAGLNHQRDSMMGAGPAVRRLAGGTPETGFNTELTSGAEKAFGSWGVPGGDDGSDYDYRGAFAAGADRDGSGHMTDQFKKPNHPTFSDESQYSQYGSPGHWNGDKFQSNGPPDWLQQYMSSQPFTDPYHQEPVAGVDMGATRNYLQDREKLRYLKSLQQ